MSEVYFAPVEFPEDFKIRNEADYTFMMKILFQVGVRLAQAYPETLAWPVWELGDGKAS